MAKAINMPQVGQDIEKAKIVEWHVKEGDAVKNGDLIATVESDKASFEVETFEEGIILKLMFSEGEEAQVFSPIAFIGNAGESIEPGESNQEESITKTKNNSKEILNIPSEQNQNKKIFASPVAKRMARNHGISLSQIKGSGPDGRIIKKDVLSYIHTLPEETQKPRNEVNQEVLKDYRPESTHGRNMDILLSKSGQETALEFNGFPGDTVIDFSKIRRRIAERLSVSKQNIPHYYLFSDIDFTDLLKWRSKTNAELNTGITINDIIVKLTAEALKEFPRLNAHVDKNKLIIKKHINIGIAVSIEDGLLVPVIPETNTKTLGEINQISKKNVADAKRGVLSSQEAGTFTVSNLGMFGISRFQAIINPPECAILSIGAVEKKVLPYGGGIAIRDIITLGLACDHRAIDGAYAAQFLNSLRMKIQNFKNIL